MAATGTPHALAVGGQVCVDLVDLGHQYADGEKMYKIAPKSCVISDAQSPSLKFKRKAAKLRLLSFLAFMGC